MQFIEVWCAQCEDTHPKVSRRSKLKRMIKIKVQKGTVDSGAENKCITCDSAVRMQFDGKETVTHCQQVDRIVSAKVVECSAYTDKRMPSLSAMNRMAWILRTDPQKKQIGFVPNKEYFKENKDEDRYDSANDPILRKLRSPN